MKVKLTAVLIAIAALFIGAVLWRTDSFVYGDRMSWVEAQSRTQLGSMNHALYVELKSLQRLVSTFNVENFNKEKFNWATVTPYYAAASFVVTNSELDPQVLLTKENGKAAAWTKEFVKSALGKIPEQTTDLRFFVKPFQDTNRGRFVALVFIEGNKAYALFGSGEIFQSLIDAQRGSLSSFSVVTASGLTVGHSVPEYLGTVMTDDPFFKEAKSSGSPHGSGTFKTKDGQELYGMFEQVPQSNLYVISSAPLAETMKGRSGLWWQFLLLGAGIVLVGLAGLLWVMKPVEDEIENLEEELTLAQQKAATMAPVEKTVVVDAPAAAQEDKVQTSMRVASALAHEMRGPLTSILGYSQMILAKTPENEVVGSTESILRETRAARDVLDKLLGYAGEEIKEKNTMKVEGPLAKALKNLDATFNSKGVKLVREFQETSPVDLHSDALSKAFENILTNAVEAMERMQKKELKIELFEDTYGIHLNIEDSGEGIEPQNLEKIFDPFFTTRSFKNHMGLGLSVAFGVLKEHNAEVRVTSERGQGTKVAMTFKKPEVDVLAAPVEEVKVEPVTISADLPSLKIDSEERKEAEVEFAEAKAKEPPSSPLDLNIDNLLELPEMPDEKTIALAEMPKEEPLKFREDEAALQEKEQLAAMTVIAEEQGPLAAELAPLDDEFAQVNLVNPPKTAAKQKESKLDSYTFEIRRPGKRI